MGTGQLARDGDRLQPGRRRLARAPHRRAAARSAVALHALLPRRGLGHRQPLALHRRGAAGGAEVLPHDPAGRRGAPLGLLQALHARGGGRRRRDDGRRPAGHGRPDHVGPPPGLQPPGPDGRRAAARQLEAQARRGGHALPRRRRGLARPAGPAHDRGLARGARRPARLPRGHAQRLARRAAPHRLRGQAPGRPLPRGSRPDPGRDRRPHQGGPAVDLGRGQAAQLGPLVHRVLRLHPGGHGRGGRDLDRAAPARHRPADRHHPRLPDADGPAAARARRARAEAAARGPHRPRRRRRRPGPRGDRDHVRHHPPRRHHRRHPPRNDDRVGLRRRRALARRARQRRLARRPGSRGEGGPDAARCASPTGPT